MKQRGFEKLREYVVRCTPEYASVHGEWLNRLVIPVTVNTLWHKVLLVDWLENQ